MDIQKISLEEALEQIAPGSSKYVNEDAIGGYHMDGRLAQFPVGAIWGVEGQFLYALVKHFKPHRIIELGTGRGAGSAHLAAAVGKWRGLPELVSVDNGTLGYEPRKTTGVEYVTADALAYLAGQDDDSVDFIFEDLDHSAETVRDVAMLALQKLAPGGILVSHDAAHWVVGEAVRLGYEQAGLEPLVFLMPPSDCGVSFWQKSDSNIIDSEQVYRALEATQEYIEERREVYNNMSIPELKKLIGADAPARAKKDKYIKMALVKDLEGNKNTHETTD